MPTTAVTPADLAITGRAWSAAGPPPAPGFADALAARAAGPSALPRVTLGEMVASMAGRGVGATIGTVHPGLPASGGSASVAAAGRGDGWGVAAEGRPAAGLHGPGSVVLDAGERYLGVPYRWGGTDPSSGFDCSGFVQQVFADLGVRLPRVSVDQSKSGVPVASLEHAQPGDLVFWGGNGSRPNHIGIYAGEGKMLVAPRTGDVVRYQEITRAPDAIRRVHG